MPYAAHGARRIDLATVLVLVALARRLAPLPGMRTSWRVLLGVRGRVRTLRANGHGPEATAADSVGAESSSRAGTRGRRGHFL